MSAVLEVSIGLGFVFLVFSLIASSLVEWVSALMDRRATFLKNALIATLGATLAKELLNHPVICGIQPVSTRQQSPRLPRPSYLSPKSVALALADISRQVSTSGSQDSRGRLQELIRALKSELLPDSAAANMAMDSEVLFRVERWFTEQMDRATATYKRWTQVGTLAAALVLTATFDVDSARIAERLYSNAAARSALAANVNNQVVGKGLAELELSIGALDELPLGWSRSPWDVYAADEWALISAIAGWAISIVAIGLGAPFWFDILNRLVSLRQTGPRPETRIIAE